jgi:hypothetical protein
MNNCSESRQSLCKPAFHLHSLLLLVLLVALPAQAAHTYQWVQYASDGLQARLITDAVTCPAAIVDGKSVAMQIRSRAKENYPVTVCFLPLTDEVKKVRVAGKNLPLPKAVPKRILVIGDTGCRLKGKTIQACNDPIAWPFRKGSEVDANTKPDLIIHVGDFHYRETPCPQGNAGCAGSPFGDNWDVWEEDFFSPVGKLLGTAPWVMVRGNHELCERGGRGWARILDPYAWDSDTGCLKSAQPFLVDLGGVTLAAMDVSAAEEDVADKEQAEFFAKQLRGLANIKTPVWLAQHRPILAFEGTTPKPYGDNKTLALAASMAMPANVQTILSGHHHALEVLTYEESFPLQLIMGNGGDELKLTVPANSDGMDIDGIHVKRGQGIIGVFGYTVLERADGNGNAWAMNNYDYDGKLLLQCAITGRDASCH